MTSATAPISAQQAACDRACLRTALDQYLNAVVKHDPKAGKFLPPLRPPAAGAPAPTNDCVSGLANFNLSMVVARRIPLADEEPQTVLGMAVSNWPPYDGNWPLPAGVVPMPAVK